MQDGKIINPKISVAIIIIILCVISLIGVTFALFTNGNDGVIGINITSGDIKIDIVDKNEATLVGDVLDFVGVDGDPNDILWEPGAVHYTEPFAIKNLGDVPVNYRVYIECKQEDAKLIEALEFYIISEETLKSTDGRLGLELLEDSLKMDAFESSLAPGELSSEYYHLVVRMKPEAGNEYQNLELTGVGITVYAVQGNVGVHDTTSATQNESENLTESETQTESESATEAVTE